MKPTTISFNWLDMVVKVNGIFKPARQAPACSNPDSAAFSDSGEAAEVDIWSAWFVGSVGKIPFSDTMLNQLREDSDLPRLLGLEK